MKSFFGWLIAAFAILLLCQMSGDLGMYMDLLSFIYAFAAIYGLTLAIYGSDLTLSSVTGFKYLFSNLIQNTKLANVYKSQIQISLVVGVIGLLVQGNVILSYVNEPRYLGPAVAIALLIVLYTLVLAALVYFPLYRKLA